MDPEKNNSNESAEELEAEKEHLAEVKEDDIRQQVIETYGFDEEDDKDRIAKAVEREMNHKKSLSSAISQKRKYRDEYQKLQNDPSKTDKGGAKASPEDLDRRLEAALTKRDLEALEYPDDIKSSIRRAMDLDGVSIKKAVSDPYITAKIEAWQKTQDATEAAISRKNKAGGKGESDDPLTPPDVDLDTEEGRKEYDKWKADMIKKGY